MRWCHSERSEEIARAITDQALAQLEKSPQRFYSLSSQIQKVRKAHYDTLEATQKGCWNLVERGVLKINPGGSKNTSYELVLG